MMKNISDKGSIKPILKKSAKHTKNKAEEIKTDPPISEKDEVKKAERRLQNNTKK